MFVKGMLTAVVLTAGVSGHALAQSTTEIVTGNGQTAVVPDAATEAKGVSPVATQVVSEYPAFNQSMNNDSIASTLLAQGFENIHILREGSLMTITATRDSNDINLVYNLVEGRLIKVNGERILSEAERTLDSSSGADSAMAVGAEDGTPGDDSGDGTEGDGTGSDDGGAGDGSTGGDDGGAGDGGSGDAGGGSDSDGGSGSDGGSDSDGGSGGDGGSGSDGGNG